MEPTYSYIPEEAVFNFCCGAIEIGDFPDLDAYAYSYDNGPMREVSLRQATKWLAKDLRNSLMGGRLYIATTIPSQRVAVAALKSAGFRRVGSWTNSNTRKRVTMWKKFTRP